MSSNVIDGHAERYAAFQESDAPTGRSGRIPKRKLHGIRSLPGLVPDRSTRLRNR